MNYFKGIKPGDVCTGTLHRFNLQSSVLVKRGVIRLSRRGDDWIFVGRKTRK